jgi:ABC-type sugar transport system substrate-binding protein
MERGAVLFALNYMAAAKLELAKGEKIAGPMVWVPFELVTPANMDIYLKKN